jgi:Uma2 family endonuclease
MIQHIQESIMTAEQLSELPSDGNRYELVQGVLRKMSTAGSEHGWIAGQIFLLLGQHVKKHKLGKTYAAETGFRIGSHPDTVRAPDAAFISHARLKTVEPTRGFLSIAPDLLVEVISPRETFSYVEAKAKQWLESGCQIVVVVDPANQTVYVHRSLSEILVLGIGETFESGEVCGNWTFNVSEIFETEEE